MLPNEADTVTPRAEPTLERSRAGVQACGAGLETALGESPRFEVEGRTLGEVLRWACRESGWRLRFAEPEVERAVETIRVRGGIGALPADQAPFAILPGAGLDAELAEGVLTVRRPG